MTLPSKAERAFAMHELVAWGWGSVSAFPKERDIAAARFRQIAPSLIDDAAVLLAILEYGAERRLANCSRCERLHVGYHAVGISEQVVRDRYGRIVEVLRDIEKAEQTEEDFYKRAVLGPGRRSKPARMRSIAESMALLGRGRGVE